MPAQSVDPGIDKEREHEAVEGASHDHTGEECQEELHFAHRAAEEVLTARTYPVGGTGSRPGSDQRAVMPVSVELGRADSYSLLVLGLGDHCVERVGLDDRDPKAAGIAREDVGSSRPEQTAVSDRLE